MKFLILVCSVALCSCQSIEETSTKRWNGPFADHKLGQNVQDTPDVAEAKAQHFNFFKDVLAVLPTLPPELRNIPPKAKTDQSNDFNRNYVSDYMPNQQGTWESYNEPTNFPQQPQMWKYNVQQPEQRISQPTVQRPLNSEQWQNQQPIHYIPQTDRWEQPAQLQSHPSVNYFPRVQPQTQPINTEYRNIVPSPPPNYQMSYNSLIQPVMQPREIKTFAEDVPRSAYGETPEVHAARQAHLEALKQAQELLPNIYETSTHFNPHRWTK